MPINVEYLIDYNVDFDRAVLKNACLTDAPSLICTNVVMSNLLLPTFESHKLIWLLYYFHRDIASTCLSKEHACWYLVTEQTFQNLGYVERNFHKKAFQAMLITWKAVSAMTITNFILVIVIKLDFLWCIKKAC